MFSHSAVDIGDRIKQKWANSIWCAVLVVCLAMQNDTKRSNNNYAHKMRSAHIQVFIIILLIKLETIENDYKYRIVKCFMCPRFGYGDRQTERDGVREFSLL